MTRLPDVIREELRDTEEVLIEHQKLLAEDPDYALELVVRFLERHRLELLEELAESIAASATRPVRLTLEGRRLDQGHPTVDFLTDLLSTFQGLLQKLAYSLSGGTARTGQIPLEILEQTQLHFVAVYPGSLSVVLLGPQHAQVSMLGETSLLATALQEFDSLVNTGPQLRAVKERVQRIGPRPLSDLRHFLQICVDVEGEARITWRDPATNEERRTRIASESAFGLLGALEHVDEPITRIEVVTGLVYAVDLRQRRIKIETDVGDSIEAVFEELLRPEVVEHVDRRSTVRIHATDTPVIGEGVRTQRTVVAFMD